MYLAPLLELVLNYIMGLFDYYSPIPHVLCPVCGAELMGWQGKDGPCMQFHWRQGKRFAVACDWPTDCPDSDTGILESFTLPTDFEIYVFDACPCLREIRAYGHCQDGMWNKTEIVTAENFVPGTDCSLKDEKRIRRDLRNWLQA